jgi:FkbM family methyltransferase
MYLRYDRLKKTIFKYRHLDFSIFLELLNKEKKGKVVFLQIGASDGQTNDPINAVVKKHGWAGTLVEPLPDVFEQLKHNYSTSRNLLFLNVAVSENQESFDLYHLPKIHIKEEWQKQLASFDKRAIEFNLRNHPELIDKIAVVKVPSADLASIFRQSGHPHTDLMIIDVEGYEYNILKQLEHISNRPDYIFFEKGTMKPDELERLHHFLVKMNYRIYTCGPDDLAVREN